MTPLSQARILAFVLPAALLAGAWSFQLFGHLVPCEMCHWQRLPHYTALALATLAFLLAARRSLSRALTVLAGIAILVSGGIGVLHAGVEYHWWTGPTRCSADIFSGGGDPLKAMLAAPLIRCDTAAWTMGGISMAGYNAILSIAGGLAILFLSLKRSRN